MHSVSFCSTCKCCSPHLMTPIKIKILLNELQWLGRENYLSSSEAKSIEIFIGRARDLFAQAVETAPPGPKRSNRAGSHRMCGHKSALQITALLLNSAVATSAAAALDR